MNNNDRFSGRINGVKSDGYLTPDEHKTILHGSYCRKISFLILFLFISLTIVEAQTVTWGGTTGTGLDWTLGSNWVGGVAPADGADVVFSTDGTIVFSTLPSSAAYNSLTISQGSISLTGSASSSLALGGNAGDDLVVATGATLTVGSLTTLVLQADASADISGTLTNSGVYDCGTGASVTTVTGLFRNSGSVSNSAADKLFFTAAGTYNHAQNGGTIPVASWDVASDCVVSGITGTHLTIPAETQPFGNFTWSCTSQNVYQDLAAQLITINGDFTVESTGSTNIQLGRFNDGTVTVKGNYIQNAGTVCIGPKESVNSMTLTVEGNFTLSNGLFYVNTSLGTGTLNVGGDFTSGGSFNYTFTNNPAIGTVNIEGNMSITAGTFNMSQTSATGTMSLGGNMTVTGTVTETSTGGGNIYFNGSGIQSYSAEGLVNNNINLTVNSGSYLQMASEASYVSGAGVFTLSPGATLGVTAPAGIISDLATLDGNIRTTGGRIFSTGASYVYNGTSAQVTGTGLTQNTPADLTISNGSGVSLTSATTITGLLTMTSGTLDMANNDLTAGSLTGDTDITNTSGSPTDVTLTIGSDGTSPAAYSGIISDGTAASVSLTKTGAGVLILSGENSYNGATTISEGTVEPGAVSSLSNSTRVVMNGGTLSTGTGYDVTAGPLSLEAGSTIALGTGVHSVIFAASDAETWNAAATLTVNGWTGFAEASGTAGKIFVGTDETGLTATQLEQISFTGYGTGSRILTTGEVVPVSESLIEISSSDPAVEAGTIVQNTTDNVIYAFSVNVTLDEAVMSGLQITTDGTYADTDVSNFKAWYSSDNSFDAASDLLLSTITENMGMGTHSFPDWIDQVIPAGSTGYIFITTDIPCMAIAESMIFVAPVTTDDITFIGGTKSGTTYPGGEQIIADLVPGDITTPAAVAGESSTELSWVNPSCFDEIMIVAKEGSEETTLPEGDGSAYAFDPIFGTPGTEFGEGFVVFRGDMSPVTVEGLMSDITYYYTFYARKGSNWSAGVTISATNVSAFNLQYRSAATGLWSDASTWEVSNDGGTTWGAATSSPTADNADITIRNGHEVTLSEDISLDQTVVETGATLTITAGLITITAGPDEYDLAVNGTVNVSGSATIYPQGTISFASGAVYNHQRNGGSVPAATWDVASLCNITGITNTAPTFTETGQAFGNLTWNCSHTAYIDLKGQLTTINGNFSVVSTSSYYLYLGRSTGANLTVGGNYTQSGRVAVAPYSSSATGTMTVNGTFTLSSGAIFYLSNYYGGGILNANGSFNSAGSFYFTSSYAGQATLYANGNCSITAGTFNMSSSSNNRIMYVKGNLSQTGGTITASSTGSGTIIFDGSGVQTLTTGSTITNKINYTIPAGNAVTINGTLTTAGAVTINSDVNTSGSLIVNGAVTNGVTYNRQLNMGVYGGNRHYLSSPVGSNSNANTGKINTVWEYTEYNNDWPTLSITAVESGHGYNLSNADGSDGLIAFTGNVVTSGVSVTLTSPYLNAYDGTYENREFASGRDDGDNWGGGGWNLLGNPYTSAISATSFLSTNTDKIDPNYLTAYLYDAEGDSYSMLSVLDGGNIQAGQGFWIMAMNNGVTVNFATSMQTHGTGTLMHKSAPVADSWPELKLKVSQGTFENYTRILYDDSMKPGLDPGYDVGKLSTSPAVEIYTHLIDDNGVNFAYQSLPVTGCADFVIPVGIDCKAGGEVVFSADIVPLYDYIFYLEDRVTGTFTDLSTSAYSVTLPANTLGTGRFYIYASNSGTPTGTGSEAVEESLHIWSYDRSIIIKGEVSSKAICEVYDTQGRVIHKKLLEDGQMNIIPLSFASKGVYIAVVRDNGKVYTQKVIIL